MTREPAPPILALTRAQVRDVDRLSIEEYRIPGIVLMENASRAATDAALSMMIDFRVSKSLILCGGGNNGGDGLAIARHLHNHSAAVTIALTIDPTHFNGDALINWQIVQAMSLPVISATPDTILASDDTLVIDAIFGTGLSQPPREPFATIAQSVADSENPVLAIDVPSGLDCDTGRPLGPVAITADRTITFVAPKSGFSNIEARRYLGEVIVGDIGCPPEVIARVRAAAAS